MELQRMTATMSDNLSETPSGMQQLLEQEKEQGYKALRRGDVIEGVVMRMDKDGVLISLGLKSEGLVPAREMRTLSPQALARIQVGDRILATVIRGENEYGEVLLSVDQARSETGWRLLEKGLESGEAIEVEVTGNNKGGLLADVEGVQGFIPLSQMGLVIRADDPQSQEKLDSLTGQTIRCKVIELNRRRNRVILSERAALQEHRAQQKEHLLAELKEGDVRHGRVTGVTNFGAFVDIGGAEGLVHISEMSWEQVASASQVVKVGDEVDVQVLKVDPESKKIALSLRRLKPEPWQTVPERYQVGQIVTGTITKLTTFGAFARIEGSVEGLVHISELSDRPIRHPKEVVKEGDTVPLKILRIEPERRRLGLSLRQAVEAGAEAGLSVSAGAPESAGGEAATTGEEHG